MSKTFNAEKFYNNIFYEIRSQKLKVGDLEKSCGLVIGYLSRRRKDLKPITIDKAFAISQYLGYTIEELHSMDIEKELIKQQIVTMEEEIVTIEEEIERLKRQVE